ncbi:MAG: hypothetical protein ACI8PT_001965, partial [Gammaproteobacteria bacterium]
SGMWPTQLPIRKAPEDYTANDSVDIFYIC